MSGFLDHRKILPALCVVPVPTQRTLFMAGMLTDLRKANKNGNTVRWKLSVLSWIRKLRMPKGGPMKQTGKDQLTQKVMKSFQDSVIQYQQAMSELHQTKADFNKLHALLCAVINSLPYKTLTVKKEYLSVLPDMYALKVEPDKKGEYIKIVLMTKEEVK